MSSDVAIRIRGLGKRYTIKHKDHDHVTLAQSALHRVRHPRTARPTEEFWALKDVEFDVPRGEVLGVIGHNGAGKSTLLKILSRITPPTTGEVQVFGRIGSLLEVGTGFHPELTGRENVYLNGSILGMKRREIDKQFDAIIDFAGIEHFLDTPVKRYSSGMYVRLAFAVAAHLNADILLLDEVLAVGDSDFQRRCLSKMGDLAGTGRTIVLVSHQQHTIESLATNVLVLEKGTATTVGSTADMVVRYFMQGSAGTGEQHFSRTGSAYGGLSSWVRLVCGTTRLEALDNPPALRLVIDLEIAAAEHHMPYRVGCRLESWSGTNIGSSFSDDQPPLGDSPRSKLQLSLPLPPLSPGGYRLSFSLASRVSETHYRDDDVMIAATSFTVPTAVSATYIPFSWTLNNGHIVLPSMVTRVDKPGPSLAGTDQR